MKLQGYGYGVYMNKDIKPYLKYAMSERSWPFYIKVET